MKKNLAFLLVLVMGLFLFLGVQSIESPKEVNYNYLPLLADDCEFVEHSYYSLCYNKKHEQSAWIYYILADSMIVGKAERKNYFSKDGLVSSGTASHADYTNSGFDRGHLLPAADMRWSQLAINETFLMSNVAPQNPTFNQYGLWRKLETKVRKWVVERKNLHLIVGGVLTDDLLKMNNTNISVPKYFYKIIFDEVDFSTIAFVLENTTASGNLDDFVVSIDSVERITGIDFFNALPEKMEVELEKATELEGWF